MGWWWWGWFGCFSWRMRCRDYQLLLVYYCGDVLGVSRGGAYYALPIPTLSAVSTPLSIPPLLYIQHSRRLNYRRPSPTPRHKFHIHIQHPLSKKKKKRLPEKYNGKGLWNSVDQDYNPRHQKNPGIISAAAERLIC